MGLNIVGINVFLFNVYKRFLWFLSGFFCVSNVFIIFLNVFFHIYAIRHTTIERYVVHNITRHSDRSVVERLNAWRVVDVEFQRSRAVMPGQLSRHSASLSTLPISRSRSNLRLTAVDDEFGSSYSTRPLSSSRPLRPSYHTGKMTSKYNYLDDIEVYFYLIFCCN